MIDTGPEVTWAGIYPAALTMFRQDGGLDLPATAAHLRYLLDEGADGVVVAGTSGEFIALEADERRAVIEMAVHVVAGRVPVIAGTGCYSTAATKELTQFAEAVGADGAIVILPYYQRPSVAEVCEHFRALSASVSIPVMAYNNPGNSAAPGLSANHLADLYAEGVIRGVKSTFPTVHPVHEIRAAADDAFRVFYGSFMAPLEGLAGGAHGWISGILNVVTRDARAMYAAISAGDLAGARAAFERILPIKQLYTEARLGDISDLVIWRAVLDARGLYGGRSRAPLQPPSDDARATLKGILATL